jgi:glycosyltransferase involved in cell wall biosynthesis
MIAPTPFFADRGCHVRILEEVRILEKLGHQVQVVTYHHGRDLPGIDIVRSVTVPWYRKLAPGPSVHKLYTDWLLVGAALHAAEHFRPHLVHGHLHEGIFVGEFLRRRYRIPLVADLQGSLADEVADHTSDRVKHLGGRMFERAERWLTSLPDCIVTSSSRFAEIVREQFGRDDVVTLADAVDTERFRPLPRSGELASAMGIPDDRQIVVFLGVLTGYQGVEHLLEAARKILKHRRKLQFLIMGYPSVESYRERAADLGIADHITFPGRIDYDRACEYLNLGDIAVSAKLSRTEANGKLFNYMACGLPVVAYDSPINREILADLGCYAEYGDTDSLAFQIDALLDDHQRRRDLAAHLRARVVEHFSWNRAGLELANLYDALLARRREQKAASQVSG